MNNLFDFIGTCWGSYLVVKLSSDVDFKAGLSMHPSHTAICAMMGVDEEKILKEVKCPQMFMPAGEDNENVKLVAYYLTAKLKTSRFSNLVEVY